MYNLHVYIGMKELLYVVFNKWQYIDVVNSSIFFLSDLEEIKSCMTCVETGNTGMGLQLCGHHLLVLLLEETVLLRTGRVCKKQKLASVCTHYPLLAPHFAGLRIYNSKSFVVKSWNIVRMKKTTVPTLE